jgi:hypothetical protein
MNQENHNPNSLVSLLRELRSETTTLLQQEVALAKTELNEKLSHMGTQAAQLAAGSFVAYAGALVLLFGLADLIGVLLLHAGVEESLAAWIPRVAVGLIVALIGWSMLAKAKKALASEKLVPERTVESLRENKEWAQSKLHHSHEPST